MDLSDVVVLVVGIATIVVMGVQIALQGRAEERARRLNERHLEILQAQSDRELSATLVATFGGGSLESQGVELLNPGSHPALEIRGSYETSEGTVASTYDHCAVLLPGRNIRLNFTIAPELVKKGAPPLIFRATYTDGLGEHSVTPGLTAYPF